MTSATLGRCAVLDELSIRVIVDSMGRCVCIMATVRRGGSVQVSVCAPEDGRASAGKAVTAVCRDIEFVCAVERVQRELGGGGKEKGGRWRRRR